jgi:hypothetical protein
MDSADTHRIKIAAEHFDGALVSVREQAPLRDFGLLLRRFGLPLRNHAAPDR